VPATKRSAGPGRVRPVRFGAVTLLRVGIAQLNPVVGDLTGNTDRVVSAIADANRQGCALVVFPELVLSGYPPEDLVLRPAFIEGMTASLGVVAGATAGLDTVAVVGFVDERDGARFNAAAVCAAGEVVGVYHKRQLPNYAVFDEQRYFDVGAEPLVLWEVGGVAVGITICEDVWVANGPSRQLGEGGAGLLVNLNGSPYHQGKVAERERVLAERVAEAGCPVVYVNQVGGQDELIFDGASLVMDANATVIHRLPAFAEELSVVDLEVPARETGAPSLPVVPVTPPAGREPTHPAPPHLAPVLSPTDEVYAALVLGTRDYARKNGFSEVVIGLSGGVDSSLVAVIAADALGPDKVHGVAMPSRYSSEHSVADATDLASRLGIGLRTIRIEPAHQAFLEMLSDSFGGASLGLTEENLQSRIRAVVLMALSNQFNWLLLTTSNKSESAVGYSTLYGDSAGGLAVIKDVPKLLVYELCRRRNEVALAAGDAPPIPESVITKPPSAELRPDQRDDQSLPPYEVLDPLLEAYVERDQSVSDLVAGGFDEGTARRIGRLVDSAEYKRRQSPPGLRVTTKAFGKDRRLPITNAFRG